MDTPCGPTGFPQASTTSSEANLSNLISVAYPDQILFECAERGGSRCDAITRMPEGYVVHVASTYRNTGELEVRAL